MSRNSSTLHKLKEVNFLETLLELTTQNFHILTATFTGAAILNPVSFTLLHNMLILQSINGYDTNNTLAEINFHKL
jgi:hypothetical protein